MQKLISLTVALVHLVCFFQTKTAEPFAQVSKYEFTHTHEHDNHHDHVIEDHPNQNPEIPHGEQPHKHEVFVSNQTPYIPYDFTTDLARIPAIIHYSDFNMQLPQDPFLLEIFRPPIQA